MAQKRKSSGTATDSPRDLIEKKKDTKQQLGLEVHTQTGKATLTSIRGDPVVFYQTFHVSKLSEAISESKGEVVNVTIACIGDEHHSFIKPLIPPTAEYLCFNSILDWPPVVYPRPLVPFPLEIVQSLPRLKKLDLCWTLREIDRIPPAILDTRIEELFVYSTAEEPYWLLYRNPPLRMRGSFPPLRETLPSVLLCRQCGALRRLILLGLASPCSTPWSVFLTKGLYDPRLFLFVGWWLGTKQT